MKQNIPIYLDYAAATPVDRLVFEAMSPYFSDNFYNPSAIYSGGLEAKRALDEARESTARSIGARPPEIIFTSGGTESTNLAISGIMDKYPKSKVIISAVEHEAVREPAKKYAFAEIPVDARGMIMTTELDKMIDDDVVLISVMYANNEVGTVQPLEKVVSIVQKVRQDRKKRRVSLPLFVHTDSCQAPLFLDVNVARLGVDLMTLNGGKMYGPKQSGILYQKAGVDVSPLIRGGGQEFGYRSGTENVASAVGFSKALEMAVIRRKTAYKETVELSQYFKDQLIKKYGATLNGHITKRIPNNIHVSFKGKDNERVLFALDQSGIYASAGSACSASKEESSHVLLAMGLSEDQARSSLRFSLGKDTTKEQLDIVIRLLKVALKA